MSEGFKPCPICGRALSEKDIEFYDDGSYIGDMEMIHDYENVMDPSNSMHPDDWKKLDESDRRQIGNNYIEAAEAVEEFMVVCPCGFRFIVDRWTTRYPERGWLGEVMEKTNRRYESE